jgi:hypothetical protein
MRMNLSSTIYFATYSTCQPRLWKHQERTICRSNLGKTTATNLAPRFLRSIPAKTSFTEVFRKLKSTAAMCRLRQVTVVVQETGPIAMQLGPVGNKPENETGPFHLSLLSLSPACLLSFSPARSLSAIRNLLFFCLLNFALLSNPLL